MYRALQKNNIYGFYVCYFTDSNRYENNRLVMKSINDGYDYHFDKLFCNVLKDLCLFPKSNNGRNKKPLASPGRVALHL